MRINGILLEMKAMIEQAKEKHEYAWRLYLSADKTTQRRFDTWMSKRKDSGIFSFTYLNRQGIHIKQDEIKQDEIKQDEIKQDEIKLLK